MVGASCHGVAATKYHGAVVRPSQLIASVGRTNGGGMRRLTIVAAALGVYAGPVRADPANLAGFAMNSLVLYQQDQDLKQRLASVDALAAYVKRLVGSCGEFFRRDETALGLDIVVAVRPGGRVRVWLLSSVSQSPADRAYMAQLRAKLESVEAPAARDGPVVFAIRGSVAGGRWPQESESATPKLPIPQEWKDALAKRQATGAVSMDGMLDVVWP